MVNTSVPCPFCQNESTIFQADQPAYVRLSRTSPRVPRFVRRVWICSQCKRRFVSSDAPSQLQQLNPLDVPPEQSSKIEQTFRFTAQKNEQLQADRKKGRKIVTQPVAISLLDYRDKKYLYFDTVEQAQSLLQAIKEAISEFHNKEAREI